MVLSDEGIIERIRTGDIELVDPNGQPVINPKTGDEREPGQLQAHGYDLRVDRVFSWATNSWRDLANGESYAIKAGQFVVIGTYERIRLTRKVAATVHAMARMTLAGLSHISTTVHPGWSQAEPEPHYIIVAVSNVSRSPITIEHRQPFCRLLFYDVSPSAKRPAPNLNIVAQRFNRVRNAMQPRYARKNSVTGVGLVLAAVVVAAVILWAAASYHPHLSRPATGVVVAILTLVLTSLQRRYWGGA